MNTKELLYYLFITQKSYFLVFSKRCVGHLGTYVCYWYNNNKHFKKRNLLLLSIEIWAEFFRKHDSLICCFALVL